VLVAGTYGKGIYCSSDSGKTWAEKNTGLINPYVTCLTVSGNRIFAGIGGGEVFVSANRGASWKPFENTLMDTSGTVLEITKLAVSHSQLYAGTNAGIWRRPLSDALHSVADKKNTSPGEFILEQNFPNPFNPSTTIRYAVPNVGTNARSSQIISIKIYDMLGREVATLVNEVQTPGWKEVQWNARHTAGGQPSVCASGIYLVRMTSGNFSDTKKIVLMK
jgi:hypothetical protein